VSLADLTGEDHVIEIGTGTVDLTLLIAERARHVWTIEIDRALVKTLEDRFRGIHNVTFLNEDALSHDYESHERPEKGHLKVIGNLPFYISTQILLRLIEYREGFERMILMLQKEVVDRLIARPSTKDYGIITLLVQPFYDVRREFILPPDAFYPRPKVDSAVVSLRRREKPAIERDLLIFYKRAVRSAFAQRRKTLKNTLLRLTDPPGNTETINEILRAARIDPKRRGESLKVEEFRRISLELERIGI